MQKKHEIDDIAAGMRQSGKAYVLATVVRTVAATAAKAGAKAVILEDGRIAAGWIGGGCARGAVLKAAKDALADGKPRLISVQPADLLTDAGVKPGSERDGIRFARNMCPSKGTMDVFIEPVLPMPDLYILGSSPVAVALCSLAGRFGFRTIACSPESSDFLSDADERIEGFLIPAASQGERYIIVSTQGRGDEQALRAALASPAGLVAFVGSKAKAAALKAELAEAGVSPADLDRLKAPAGLDIGAITPEEIALSILAELTHVRRRGGRDREA